MGGNLLVNELLMKWEEMSKLSLHYAGELKRAKDNRSKIYAYNMFKVYSDMATRYYEKYQELLKEKRTAIN